MNMTKKHASECKCERCGIPILDAKNGNRRYCTPHFIEVNRERNRENKRRRRAQGVVEKQDEWFKLVAGPETMQDLVGNSFSALEIKFGLEPGSAWVDQGSVFSKNGNIFTVSGRRMVML